MSLDPPKFQPHGVSRFEVRGQVLILYSQGPFNAEHIQSLAPAFREFGQQLQQGGPWATVNVISVSMMLTTDGLEMMRKSALWQRDHLGRVAAAYVAAADVEGRFIIEPRLRDACLDIFPIEFFDDLPGAEAWALARIAAASSTRTQL